MVVVEAAGITDVGQKRKGNEDSFSIDDGLQFYIVADGMGGHLAGEVASGIVVSTMLEYMKRFGGNKEVEELENCDETLSTVANRLLASIHLANTGVNQVSVSKPSCQGMGSTVSAVCFTEETFIAANVGDSPIYFVHNNEIETISVPHTVAAEQAALNPEGVGQLSAEFGHMLTQGMGIKDTVSPDVSEIQCFKNDILIICSDGLSDKVTPDEILAVVNQENPENACRTLVDTANARGGEDNITVIIIRIKNVIKKNGFRGMIYRLTGL